MGKREGIIEDYLVERVEAIGGLTYKFVSPGHRGVPDRIVIYFGIVFFVEVKSVDGVYEPGQKREIQRLRERGANTSVVFGKGAVDTFINGLITMGAEKRVQEQQ